VNHIEKVARNVTEALGAVYLGGKGAAGGGRG
jgi:hypothetical protein